MPKKIKPIQKGGQGSGPSHSIINKNEAIVRKMQMEKFKKFMKGGK